MALSVTQEEIVWHTFGDVGNMYSKKCEFRWFDEEMKI